MSKASNSGETSVTATIIRQDGTTHDVTELLTREMAKASIETAALIKDGRKIGSTTIWHQRQMTDTEFDDLRRELAASNELVCDYAEMVDETVASAKRAKSLLTGQQEHTQMLSKRHKRGVIDEQRKVEEVYFPEDKLVHQFCAETGEELGTRYPRDSDGLLTASKE